MPINGYDRPISGTLATTSPTTVYTVTPTYANLIMVQLVNKTSGAVVATAEWVDTSAGTTNPLLYQYSIPPNGTVMIEPPGMLLAQGDSVLLTAGTASALGYNVVIREIAGRNG